MFHAVKPRAAIFRTPSLLNRYKKITVYKFQLTAKEATTVVATELGDAHGASKKDRGHHLGVLYLFLVTRRRIELLLPP